MRPPPTLSCLAIALLTGTIAAQPPLTSVRIANGLARPVYVGTPAGDHDRLFVLEQHSGLVRIVKAGAVMAQPFLNVRTRILTGSERGLLGLAFHPQYATNGHFYVNYTRAVDGATIVERFTVSANDPDVADPNSGTVILGPVTQPFSNHNGGCLAFGRDGYLYVSFGDGGSGGDPSCNAQNGLKLLGKILRLDVDGGSPYAIPAGNPFVLNPEFRDEIWTYGWRNPWRFSFDRATGDMYVGDVGQSTREEISFQNGSSRGGENFGWKIMEGKSCFSTASCFSPPPCNSPALVLPIHDYATGANCSVIGGYVYRGCAIPGLEGTYFFGDYCSGRIWSLRYDGQNVTGFTERTAELVPATGGSIDRITSFGEDARGEIYVTDLDGEIYQIIAAGPPPAVNLGYGTAGGMGLAPVFEVCGLLGVGQSAQMILRHAAASSATALLLSNVSNPTVFGFGTVVPVPPLLVAPLTTDARGEVQLTIPGGLGPAVVFGQWGVLDSAASSGVALSNALQITWP